MESLTPAGEVLAAEIARSGPIPFSRFMDVALYHPEFGYYRRRSDPFGAAGDFYTAEQLQPVFGRLVATYLWSQAREFALEMPATVVELGAGRREMSESLSQFQYVPVDIGYGEMPAKFSGIVFSNEFFDAVPVDLIAGRADSTIELRVTFDGERFKWIDGPPVHCHVDVGLVRETQAERLRWLDRIDESLERGFVITIDYGYTTRELIRFPQGTLMSYRRHQAIEDVLAQPGERDITAHVSFTDLQEYGAQLGWTTVAFKSFAGVLMSAGEPDQFESALAGVTEMERTKHRLQLKSLLFGLGETFRVLVQRKG